MGEGGGGFGVRHGCDVAFKCRSWTTSPTRHCKLQIMTFSELLELAIGAGTPAGIDVHF